jgi:hypothetical protein
MPGVSGFGATGRLRGDVFYEATKRTEPFGPVLSAHSLPNQKIIFVPIWMFRARLFWLVTLPNSALVGLRFGLL